MAMINKDTVKIAYSAIVCSERTQIEGDVTIGLKNVVHPTAKILAEKGPIVFGDFNLIEENTVIHNKSTEPMLIGNHNVFEVGCRSETNTIGDHNVFEAKSFVGPKVVVTSGCVIGAMCRVDTEETLPPKTLITGRECSRRQQVDKPSDQILQIEFLAKVLPNYTAIERPNHRLPPGSIPPK